MPLTKRAGSQRGARKTRPTWPDQSVCKTYVDAQCDLSDAGAVYDTCENHQDFQSYYNAMAAVFCGDYSTDAGAGDAGTDASDASADADDGSADAAMDAPDGD